MPISEYAPQPVTAKEFTIDRESFRRWLADVYDGPGFDPNGSTCPLSVATGLHTVWANGEQDSQGRTDVVKFKTPSGYVPAEPWINRFARRFRKHDGTMSKARALGYLGAPGKWSKGSKKS